MVIVLGATFLLGLAWFWRSREAHSTLSCVLVSIAQPMHGSLIIQMGKLRLCKRQMIHLGSQWQNQDSSL